MATVVDNLPPNGAGRPVTGSKYDQFLDGQVWKLSADEDFTGKPTTTRSAIASRAQRRSIKLKTRILDGDLYVQAVAA